MTSDIYFLGEYFQKLAEIFFNPQKRLFVGYLLIALFIALLWMVLVEKVKIKQAFSRFFAKNIWWSQSSRLDCQMVLANRLFLLLVSPYLLAQMTVASALFYGLHEWLPARPQFLQGWSSISVGILFTTVYFIVDDFSRFYVHRLLHRWPVLWAFHKVHHTAETLTPVTVLRTHPVEAIVFSLRTVLVQAIMIAGFVFFVGERVTLVTVLGASFFTFIFNVLGSNLRHSQISIRYFRCIEKWFFSPAQHHIHHSVDVRHHDKNFGVVLSIWDRLGGSFMHSQADAQLIFGIKGEQYQNIGQAYWRPVKESASVIASTLKVTIKNFFELSNFNILKTRESIEGIESIMNKKFHRLFGVFMVGTLFSALFFSSQAVASGEVYVYSARKEALIKPILKTFTEKTGIEVKLITGKADALLTRLRLEGKASPADVFITVDAGRLQRAKAAGVLQAINSAVLEKRIPEHLRDKDKIWFGLSQRARPIFYAKGKVKATQLSTYEALADKKWKGRICFRSSNSVYNQSQLASMMEAAGEKAAEQWVKAVVANFARSPAGGDTDQLKAVAVGVCDITIANTYYYGRLINSDKASDREIAQKVGLFWPNQKDRGTHVNVSGAGVTKYARNKANAIKLIEFLASDKAQNWYAAVNNEFPVVPSVASSPTLESWGSFKQDSVNLSKLGELNRAAVQLMDRGGWK